MLIHEVANASGLTKDTVRYYTKMGLIEARQRQAGSRVYADYDESVLKDLEDIRFAKSAGFTLGELLVDGRRRDRATNEEALRLLKQKLIEIEQKKNDLEAVAKTLRAKIKKLSR